MSREKFNGGYLEGHWWNPFYYYYYYYLFSFLHFPPFTFFSFFFFFAFFFCHIHSFLLSFSFSFSLAQDVAFSPSPTFFPVVTTGADRAIRFWKAEGENWGSQFFFFFFFTAQKGKSWKKNRVEKIGQIRNVWICLFFGGGEGRLRLYAAMEGGGTRRDTFDLYSFQKKNFIKFGDSIDASLSLLSFCYLLFSPLHFSLLLSSYFFFSSLFLRLLFILETKMPFISAEQKIESNSSLLSSH